MHAWEQIQQSVDYIEEHLSEPIRIEKLAEIAALSPFYYQRLFRRLVKKPVIEYIKLRRMAKATEALLQKEKRILDVALELGFSSHEHFSRTFKETFDRTPEDYRKKPIALNRMTKPQLLLNYLIVDENVPLIRDGIVLEISRKQLDQQEYFIGKEAKAPIQFVEGLGIESGKDPLDSLWRNFHNCKASIRELMPDGDELGACYPSSDEGYFCYFAGAQANAETISSEYKNWRLPAGSYIVCSFEAEDFESLVMDALYKAQSYLFDTWLPNHQLATEPFSIERYERHDAKTTKMEIWVKPIKIK